MPGESKKISELESASSLNNGDLLELASVNALSETGYSSKKTTIEDVADKIATLNPQAQADWIEADDTDPSYIQNKPTLATVATSGSYNDLLDQPQIPSAQVNSDWNSVSGVSEILNKPTLGTAASKNTGVANGVAELDANGLVPTSQLPAYVDDVLEYASQSAFPATGETGKIYVALDTNLTYRWSGSEYVEISPSLALGETSSTAYAGNKGKANADAIAALQTAVGGLATVATSGSYTDLSNKPAIPDGLADLTDDVNISSPTDGQVLKYDGTSSKWVNGTGGGGSGGHTILDDEGTSLTQRNDLQFKGAYSVDNGTDQITEVNVVREMTKAEFDLLTDDEKVGIINVTDEGGSPDRNYSETTLWSGSETPTTSGTQITLSDNISNYDEIVFVMDTDYVGTGRFLVSELTIGERYISTIYAPTEYGVYWSYDSDTTVTIKRLATAHPIEYIKVVGIKYGNGTQTFHNYSTAEHEVGTWIDGSTLYEKTISIGSLPDTTEKIVPHNITNLLYAVSITGVAKNSSGNQLPLPYADIVDAYEINISVDNTNIHINTGRDRTLFSGYITIRYTKSTT